MQNESETPSENKSAAIKFYNIPMPEEIKTEVKHVWSTFNSYSKDHKLITEENVKVLDELANNAIGSIRKYMNENKEVLHASYLLAMNDKIREIASWNKQIKARYMEMQIQDNKEEVVVDSDPVKENESIATIEVNDELKDAEPMPPSSDDEKEDGTFVSQPKNDIIPDSMKQNTSTPLKKKEVLVPVIESDESSVTVVDATSGSDEDDFFFDDEHDNDSIDVQAPDDEEISFITEKNDEDKIPEENVEDIVFEEKIDEKILENNKIAERENSHLHGIKDVSKASTNSMIKLMSKLDVDITKVPILDVDFTKDENFRRNYIESKNNMLSAPRVTRTIHPISGFYSEISAYSEFDQISINRNLALENDFVRQETLIYNSIFSHVVYTSLKKAITFDEWTDALLIPDLNSLYFGLYDCNYPGINEYKLECGNCRNEIENKTDNDDLGCWINPRLNDNYINELVNMSKVQKLLDNTIRSEIISKDIRKRLPNTGIIVRYGMPSLKKYLETIEAMQAIFHELNINVEISDINNPDSPSFGMLRIFLYIKELGLPVKGERKPDGKIPIKYVSVKDVHTIVGVIAGLNSSDFKELFKGQEVKELTNVKGLSYFIKNVTCPHCKSKLRPVSINPRELFFFKLGDEATKFQMS